MSSRFEQEVRERILSCGVTYTQLAREAGISSSQVGRFMCGSRGLSGETLGKILDLLGVSLGAQTRQLTPKPVGRPRKPVYLP